MLLYDKDTIRKLQMYFPYVHEQLEEAKDVERNPFGCDNEMPCSVLCARNFKFSNYNNKADTLQILNTALHLKVNIGPLIVANFNMGLCSDEFT